MRCRRGLGEEIANLERLYSQFDERIVYCSGMGNNTKAAFCRYRGKESMNILGKFYKSCDYA